MPAKRKPVAVADPSWPEAQKAVLKTLVPHGKRTSLRLEPLYWEVLSNIGQAEGLKIDQIVEIVDGRRGDASLAAAVRVFALAYCRAMAGSNPTGHKVPGQLPEK